MSSGAIGTNQSYDSILFGEKKGTETVSEVSKSKNKHESYKGALATVRELLTQNDAADLVECINVEAAKVVVKKKILEYVKQESINVVGYEDPLDLAEELFKTIAGLDFLEDLLIREDIEEINANAWNDIEIITDKGWQKLEHTFQSPTHAIDVVRKMVEMGNKTLDEKTPQVDSFLGTGLRISATIPPIVDASVGVVFSLRKQKNEVFSKDFLVKNGTLTDKEFELMRMFLDVGKSIGFGGETGSGKTATMQSILKAIAEEGEKRICSMEEDTRELNLIHEEDGKVKSRVIHTKTRPSEDPSRDVSPDRILKLLLRFNPNIIVAAEMRGKEAMTAQEAARTGHAVVTSFHTEDVTGGYLRILTMCMMSGTHLSEDLMLGILVNAFPLMVIIEKLPDGTRKITKIFEATGYDVALKKIKGRMLFRFVVKDKERDKNGRITKIIGEHKQVNPITDKMANHLFSKGYDLENIKEFASKEWNPLEGDGDVGDDFIFE